MDLKNLIHKKEFIDELTASIRNIIFANFPGISPAEKEDIDQEVKLKILNKIAHGKPIGNLRSYLWKVVYTTTLDVLNNRLPHELIERLKLEEHDITVAFEAHCSENLDLDSPESIAQKNERLIMIRQAIDALPFKRRLVVRMHFDGMSIEKIALFLAWSPNKVRHLLYRGIDNLKKKLQDDVRFQKRGTAGFKKPPA